MKNDLVPAWDDRDELLRALSGDWQLFSQPPSQLQSVQLAEYVCGGLLEYRFEVEVIAIDDPQRVLRIWIVVSGDYGHHLQPFIERTINEWLPPGKAVKMCRRLCDLRRTARGAWFVESGFPKDELALQPPAIHLSDARWEERVEQGSDDGDGDDENRPTDHAHPDVVEYQGLQLNQRTRRLSKRGEEHWAEISSVQVAILKQLFTNRETWVDRRAIEQVINDAKTKPGQQPYRSEDLNLVNRNVTALRKVLTQFGANVVNDRSGGFRITVSCTPATGSDEDGA